MSIVSKQKQRQLQRLLSYKELKAAGVPYSRMHLRRLMQARKFPQQVQLSSQRIGWFEHELADWFAQKAAARDAKIHEVA